MDSILLSYDWSGYLALEDKKIDKNGGDYRGVTAANNANSEWVIRRLFRFGDTRYAHRNMLGTEEFLRTFDSQMLRDFTSAGIVGYRPW
ncbi:MAG: hypothetical protein ACLUDU_06800 [Butyricimonas faecihominis]